MRALTKHAAEDAVAQLELEASNAELAGHWLSLWQGDDLPQRAAFRPAALKPYLPSILLFDVVPDESVTVRLAGTGYRYILGAELTGRDWIAAAPQSHRAMRLGLFSTVARGSVVMAHRRIAMTTGEDYLSEEILLPFAREANGAHPVLVHVNFRPRQFLEIRSLKQVTGDPLDWKMLPLG
jgi:hypothetical protein